MKKYLAIAVAVASLTAATTWADDAPPANSKLLSAILESAGDKDVVVSDVELDDGVWEVTTHKEGTTTVLFIDPVSGEEKQRRASNEKDDLPPADAKPLLEIVKHLEDEKMGTITEAEFDDGFWEINAIHNGQVRKMKIDPRSGERVN